MGDVLFSLLGAIWRPGEGTGGLVPQFPWHRALAGRRRVMCDIFSIAHSLPSETPAFLRGGSIFVWVGGSVCIWVAGRRWRCRRGRTWPRWSRWGSRFEASATSRPPRSRRRLSQPRRRRPSGPWPRRCRPRLRLRLTSRCRRTLVRRTGRRRCRCPPLRRGRCRAQKCLWPLSRRFRRPRMGGPLHAPSRCRAHASSKIMRSRHIFHKHQTPIANHNIAYERHQRAWC